MLRSGPKKGSVDIFIYIYIISENVFLDLKDGMPSVVLGVGILCMLAAFSAVSSVISATVTSELD